MVVGRGVREIGGKDMDGHSVRRWRAGAFIAAILLLAATLGVASRSTAATAATSTTFSGQATALKGNLFGLGPLVTIDCKDAAARSSTICLAATQSFSGATEINDEASVLCYPAEAGKPANCAISAPDLTGGVLALDVLHASVVARGNRSSAEAYVARFELALPGATISATALRTTAEAKCVNGAPSVSGGEETTVTINDTTLNVSRTVQVAAGAESEKIALPAGLGYIVLNEGASSGRAGNDITVSALHVVVPALGIDLFVAQAHADISCATNGCAGKNAFVTGGGFIDWSGKAHFAVAGRNLTAWGHVLYGPTKLHVKNPTANVYDTRAGLRSDPDYPKFAGNVPAVPDPDTFQGAAILTWRDAGGSVLGQALVIDMGEPGRDDFFEILTTNATAWGRLAGGNIQMHGKCA
jgi:hypothetical protein